jgi:hypothetical protein
MLKRKVLIRKLGRAIDIRRARAVSIQEIATLDHEVFDLRRAIAHTC